MSTKYFHVKEHIISSQHIREYFHSTANSEDEELQLAVKQYIPLDNTNPQAGDVTIIAAHAAGFFKELYEPLFDDLYNESRRTGKFRIRSIWIADVCTHGRSGILNEEKLGFDLRWDDHARDLLHMTNVFRREMPRPLVGLGHSMGGTQIVQLSLLHPRLFSAVICVEPILNKDYEKMNFGAAYWLTERKDVWPSKEAAIQDNKKSGLLKTWDSRVAEAFCDYGFRELPTLLHPKVPASQESSSRPVTFTTTKHHDARAYARDCYPTAGQALADFVPGRLLHSDITKTQHIQHGQPIYRPEAIQVFQQLKHLRPPCLFVYGDKSTMNNSKPAGRADKLAVTGIGAGGSGGAAIGAVDQAILAGTHFVVLEHPGKVAEVAAKWIDVHLQAWREQSAAQSESWKVVGPREKAMVSENWRWWVKEAYARKPKQSRPKDQQVVTSRL